MSGPTPSATATIIPFPPPRARVVPGEGEERLRRALQALDEALARQRRAVAAWRGALGELSGVASGLGHSLRHYRAGLDALVGRIDGLHAQAVRLERTADAALAISRGSPR